MAAPLPPLLAETMLFANALVIALVAWAVHRTVQSLKWPQNTRNLVFGVSTAVLVGWFVAAYFLAETGFFQGTTFLFPHIGLLFLPIVLGLWLIFSERFKPVFGVLPLALIFGIQTFRLLGWYFLDLHARGLMPAEFALPSGWGDVLIGITAPVVAYAYFVKKPYAKKLAIGWNVAGLADLATAIFLGFFTSPTPYQALALDLPNSLLFAFPLALIPTFAVPLSILLHAASLKALSVPR
ncbi:hypothetical protein HY572_03430 [Candidatus Micrarchaeota archaeon]|nr:hypothetical protein [Candidatus Micrarchaeota archaeon]